MTQQPSHVRPRLFYSSQIRGDIKRQLGQAHYSYRLVAERFARAFENNGYTPELVELPEKYKTPRDLHTQFGETENPVHIAFRPPEFLRPMPCAWNIAHFAWEFDVLKDRELDYGPIAGNQVHMLNLVDEIWTPCSYTCDVLHRYGLRHAEIVPTPVCGADLPGRLSRTEALNKTANISAVPLLLASGLSSELHAQWASGHINGLGHSAAIRSAAGANRIFLTVCNPNDLRKNLLDAIDGFTMAAGEGAVLIVKLIVPAPRNTGGSAAFEHLSQRLRGPGAMYRSNVLLIADFLPPAEMHALYSLADFYLCASHCEGFNLPLLEAMAHGVIPVSTRNTAMRDYIDESNAIIIAERSIQAALEGMASDVAGLSTMISVAGRFDIGAAVGSALEMTQADRAVKCANARSIVFEKYSEAAVMRIVRQRFASRRPRTREAHEA